MNKRERINEILDERGSMSFTADGFDEAIIGLCGEKVVYDEAKCLELLMTEQDMDELEAIEYFNFNVAGAYIGEHTPLFVEVV